MTPLMVLDLLGTFVFALSGASAGVKHRLDLFGVLVLSFAAGNSGGIARRSTPWRPSRAARWWCSGRRWGSPRR